VRRVGGVEDERVRDSPQARNSDRRVDCLTVDLSGSWRYALEILTAPNWLARVRMVSAMLYPEALVDDAQFSVWDPARECVVG